MNYSGWDERNVCRILVRKSTRKELLVKHRYRKMGKY